MKGKNKKIVLGILLVLMVAFGCMSVSLAEETPVKWEFAWEPTEEQSAIGKTEVLNLPAKGDFVIRVENLDEEGEGSVEIELIQDTSDETILTTDPVGAGESTDNELVLNKGTYSLNIYANAKYIVTIEGNYHPQLNAAKLVLIKGEKKTVKLEYGGQYIPRWKSGDASVAAVTQDGVITGIATGVTDIVCRVNGTELRVKVYVASLNNTKASLKAGQSTTFKVNFAGGAKLSWSSSNRRVATVNNGVVKAIGAGKAIISVKINNNKVLKATVTVIPTISKSKVTLYVGKTVALKVNGANGQKGVWSSSNRKVATVNANGLVKAVSAGTAVISCRIGSTTLKTTVKVWTKESLYNKVYASGADFYGDSVFISFINKTGLTVDRIDFTAEMYDVYGKRIKSLGFFSYSGFNSNIQIDDGLQDGGTTYGSWDISDYDGVRSIRITVTKFHLTNGTTIDIPESKQVTKSYKK